MRLGFGLVTELAIILDNAQMFVLAPMALERHQGVSGGALKKHSICWHVGGMVY